MTSRNVAFMVGAFLVGASVAFALGRAVGLGSAAPNTTTTLVSATTTSTSQAPPVFVAANETVLGPAVLVPGSLTVEQGQVMLRYELHSLAPLADADPIQTLEPFTGPLLIEPSDVDTVWPGAWVLETTGGELPGSTSNPAARVARFDIPEDFTLDEVTGIRLDSYVLRVPLEQPFVLTEGAAPVEIVPGVSSRTLNVVVQGEQTIVQVEVLAEVPINTTGIAVEGRGPRWASASREAEGRPRWNLRFDGSDLPEEITLVLRGSIWVEVPIDVVVRARSAG
jgi:hypothetical protein